MQRALWSPKKGGLHIYTYINCILIQAWLCIYEIFIQCKVIATGIPWVGVSWSNRYRTSITLSCGTNSKGSPSDSVCNLVVFRSQRPGYSHLHFVYLYSPFIYIFNHDFIALRDSCSDSAQYLRDTNYFLVIFCIGISDCWCIYDPQHVVNLFANLCE